MENENHFTNEIVAFFSKWWIWFFYVFMGLIGKMAIILGSGKKRTVVEDISSLLVAGFVGYLSAIWCIYKYPAIQGGYSIQGAIVVPMATLLSDRIMTFLLNVNWVPIMEILIGKKKK